MRGLLEHRQTLRPGLSPAIAGAFEAQGSVDSFFGGNFGCTFVQVRLCTIRTDQYSLI